MALLLPRCCLGRAARPERARLEEVCDRHNGGALVGENLIAAHSVLLNERLLVWLERAGGRCRERADFNVWKDLWLCDAGSDAP
jgi:hypothetical protein